MANPPDGGAYSPPNLKSLIANFNQPISPAEDARAKVFGLADRDAKRVLLGEREARNSARYEEYKRLPPSPERDDLRKIILDSEREIARLRSEIGLPAASAAPSEDAPEQSNSASAPEPNPVASPTLQELQAYFANHPIQFGKTTVDPAKLPEEKLREIYELQAQADEAAGPDEPYLTIDDFNGGREPDPNQLAYLAHLQEAQNLRKQQARAEAAQLREQQRAEARAERDQAKAEAAQLREQQRAEARAERAQADEEKQRLALERAQQQQTARRQQLALETGQRLAGVINASSVRLGQLPQPGGIGLLLVTILFILFAIAPMNHNGDTRLQLLWLSLVGKTKLPTSGKTSLSAGNSSGSGSGSGGSGSGGGGWLPWQPPGALTSQSSTQSRGGVGISEQQQTIEQLGNGHSVPLSSYELVAFASANLPASSYGG